jgi:hypothetical protein
MIAGVVYLIGVAVILITKPSLMFTPDGDWKEFGIGQLDTRYTPFPFWMFCLVWAMTSYVLVLLFESISVKKNTNTNIFMNENSYSNKKINRKNNYSNQSVLEEGDGELDLEAVELPKGYYVLNKKATKLSGVPKYVYLGPEQPSD